MSLPLLDVAPKWNFIPTHNNDIAIFNWVASEDTNSMIPLLLMKSLNLLWLFHPYFFKISHMIPLQNNILLLILLNKSSLPLLLRDISTMLFSQTPNPIKPNLLMVMWELKICLNICIMRYSLNLEWVKRTRNQVTNAPPNSCNHPLCHTTSFEHFVVIILCIWLDFINVLITSLLRKDI